MNYILTIRDGFDGYIEFRASYDNEEKAWKEVEKCIAEWTSNHYMPDRIDSFQIKTIFNVLDRIIYYFAQSPLTTLIITKTIQIEPIRTNCQYDLK